MFDFLSLVIHFHMDANISYLNIDYVIQETAISANLSNALSWIINKDKHKLSL